MSWLHPGLLALGSAAVTVPIVLHLIHRKRGPRVHFSAVRFLYDTDLPTARHLRLGDRLLLLLRVLALLALAAWLARPYRELPATASQLGEKPANLVLLLDNSFSLLFEEADGTTRLDRAKAAARALIESLREGDRAAVLSVVATPAQVDRLSTDREELLAALSATAVAYGRPDPTGAVRRALDLLHDDPESDRRIYLFTDLQRAGWSHTEAPPEADRVPLIVVDVRAGERSPNHGVLRGALSERLSFQTTTQEVEIEVGRFAGDEGGEIPIALYDEEELLSQGLADPPANGTQSKRLSYDAARDVSARGRIVLEPDSLPIDDERYVILRSLPLVRALLVDGDPRPVDYLSETFFIENALSPSRQASSRVRAQTIRADAFRDASLEQVQAVVLANVAAADLGPAGWGKLERFVADGGGVLIALGDRVDPDEYNRVAASLLPARLRLKLDVSGRSFSQQAGELHASRLTQVELTHPALRLFGKNEQVDFARAAFGAYILTEPVQARKAATLMRFGNGAPALLEGRVGQGRVLLWTSALDMGWGDFCIKPTFLPLMHQLVYYLANALRDVAESSYVVGERVRLRPPAGAARAEIKTPGGKVVDLPVDASASELPLLFTATDRPGIYEATWRSEGGGQVLGSGEPFWFAVNLPPSESDLRPLEEGALEEMLHLSVHTVGAAGSVVGGARGLFARQRREEHWRAGALALALFLFGESLAGLLFSRHRRRRAL